MTEKGPRITLSTEQVMVFDDVLTPAQFAELHGAAGEASYRMVHDRSWQKVWRLHDGMPLATTPVWLMPGARRDVATYPTGGAVDPLVERIVTLSSEAEGLLGAVGRDWVGFNVRHWVYPAGSGLSLHRDSRGYTGSYVYFLHPEWNLHWGGLLIVLDPGTPTPPPRGTAGVAPWLDDSVENTRVWEPGLGLCVMAKPNRLVFITGAAEHLITKVDGAAGTHPRVSVAGFFYREVPSHVVGRPSG